jgi:hypothetical protein
MGQEAGAYIDPWKRSGRVDQIFPRLTLAKYCIRALMVENRSGGCRTLRF